MPTVTDESPLASFRLDDRLIVVKVTTPAAINLPLGRYQGQHLTINDGTGQASKNHITITARFDDAAHVQQTIRGSTSYVIANDWGSVTLEWNAGNGEWTVIAIA